MLLAFVLGPTLLLAVRSPVALLVAPTLAWRLATASPGYWTTTFHCSAVFAPVLVTAFVDALPRTRWPRELAVAAAAVAVAITMWPGHARPLARLGDPGFWRDTSDTYPLSPAGNRQEVARLEAQGWRVLLDQDGVVALRHP